MSGNFTIRPALPADIPELNELLYRAFDTQLRSDYPSEVLDRAVPLMGRARPELVISGTYFVAADTAGRLLGAGGWSKEPPHGGEADAHLGNIRHFGVDPVAARRGVASAIMAHVVRDAAGQGMTCLDCLSTLSAVGFYRSAGFEPLGGQDVMLGEGVPFPVIHMVRHLLRAKTDTAQAR